MRLGPADTEDGTICGLHAARGAAFGFVLHGYAELPSTNDEARRLAEAGAPHGTVVHATRQTAGRGRQGRTWLSPEGNLHVSFLLRPGIPARRAHEIGFVAAVAVSDTVDPLLPMGYRVALKWPNDVLIGGAKLGGILAEWLMDDAVVLGIGLNVRHSPGGLAYPTTCLAAEGCELDAPAVLLRLVDVVAAGMDAWCAGGFAPVRAAWMARGPALGAELRMLMGETQVAGHYAGLDLDGALLLRTATGLRRVIAGQVA